MKILWENGDTMLMENGDTLHWDNTYLSGTYNTESQTPNVLIPNGDSRLMVELSRANLPNTNADVATVVTQESVDGGISWRDVGSFTTSGAPALDKFGLPLAFSSIQAPVTPGAITRTRILPSQEITTAVMVSSEP